MSQEIDMPPAAEIDSALEPQKPPVKKRRWLRRFIWLFIILAVFIYLISGVGARKAGEYFINKSLSIFSLSQILFFEPIQLEILFSITIHSDIFFFIKEESIPSSSLHRVVKNNKIQNSIRA